MFYIYSIGIVTSARRFNIEKFSLFHQQAVSLCGSTLAFLSVNQQLIYVMKLLPEGSLFLHQTIGRYILLGQLLCIFTRINRN